MASPNDSSPFETVEFSKLRGLAERFEQAWDAQQDSTKGIDLAPFLPEPGDPARSVALIELIKADLACRWQRGLPTSLEMYVEKFPEMGPLEKLAPSLIYEEYRIRTRHGSPAPLNQYKSRFPRQFSEFESLIQTEQSQMGGITSGGEYGTNTPVTPQVNASPLSMVGNGTLVGGHYTLNKRIGTGGFGEVWLGNDIHGNIPKAIKIITRSVESDEAKQELHALEIIKRLNHPYLLRTEGFFAEQERLIVVMELADGSLREMLKKVKKESDEGLPVEKLLVYMRHAAEALDYLHEEGIFHRDIKPENILLVGKIAKVADFGLAKLAANRQSTKTNFAGTSAYSSPETWKGRVTSKSDLYSLAVTYAELRLGRPVFKGSTIYEFMIEHLQAQPNLDPMPDEEREVLLRALAKEPSDRYGNCTEFIRELDRAVSGPGSLPATGAGPRHSISGSPTPVSKWATPVSGRPGSSGSLSMNAQRGGSTNASQGKPPSWKTPSYPDVDVSEPEQAQPYRRSRRRSGANPVLVVLGLVIVLGLALCGASLYARSSLETKVQEEVANRNFVGAVKAIDDGSVLVAPFKAGLRDDVLKKGLDMADKARKSDNIDELTKTTVALFDAFPKDEKGPALLNEGLQKQIPDWVRREQFAKAYETLNSLPLDVPAKREHLPEITKKWLEKAWEEIDRGDFPAAKQITGEFLRVDPGQKDATAVNNLATAAENARNLIIKGKYREVMEKIPRNLPARGQKLGDKIRAEVRTAWLKDGEALHNGKNYDAAQQKLVQFSEFFKNDAEGNKQLKEAFKELFKDYFKNERYEDALALLAKTNFEFTDLLDNVKTTWRDREIERFKSGDELAKERALQGLSKLAKQFGSDYDLRDVYGKYKGEYVQTIVPQIEANLKAKNIRQALDLIDKAAPFVQDSQLAQIKYLELQALIDDPTSGPVNLKAVENALRQVMKQPDTTPRPDDLLKGILRVGRNDPSFFAAIKPELIAFREVIPDDRMPPEFWPASGLSKSDSGTSVTGSRKILIDANNLFKRQEFDPSLNTLTKIDVRKETDKALKRDYYTLLAKLGEKGVLSRSQVKTLEQSLADHPELKPYLAKVMTQTIARSWKTWPIAPDSWASRIKDADDAEAEQPIVVAFKAEGLLETGKRVDFKLPAGKGEEEAYVNYVRAIVAASGKKKEDTIIAARTLEKMSLTDPWLVPARRENASKILQLAALELTRTPDGSRRLFESAREAGQAYVWLDKALQLKGKSAKDGSSLPVEAQLTLALAAGCKAPAAFDVNKSLGDELLAKRRAELSDGDRVNLVLSNPSAFAEELKILKASVIGVNEVKAMVLVGESQLALAPENAELSQRQAMLYSLEGWALEQVSLRDTDAIFNAYSKASTLEPENDTYLVAKGRFGAISAIIAAAQENDSDKKIRLLKQGVNACDASLKKNLVNETHWADLCLRRSQLELDLGNEYYRKDQRDGQKQSFANARKFAELARDAKIPHPKKADVWLALGNALEDLAHFAGEDREKNFEMAADALDKAGKLNLDYYFNAGRCRYRWATNANIAIEKGKKLEIAKNAISNLDPIAANSKNPYAAEAGYWEGHVYWSLLGDELKAFDSFKQTLALGKKGDESATWARYSLDAICVLASRRLKTDLKRAETWVDTAKSGWNSLKDTPAFAGAEQTVTDVDAELNFDLAKKSLLDKDYAKFKTQMNVAFELKHSQKAYAIAIERALLFKINRTKLDLSPQFVTEIREQAISTINASTLSDEQKRKERGDMDDLWKKI